MSNIKKYKDKELTERSMIKLQNNENNNQEKPENNNIVKEKDIFQKKGFFKKLWYSIVKIEKYPEMATEGVPRAFSYLIKLVAIFVVVACLCSIYQLNVTLRNGVEYLEDNFPEFSYKDGILEVQADEPIVYEDNPEFGKMIIDTKSEDESKINEYTEDIMKSGSGVIVLRDKVIIKTQAVTATAIYEYSDLFSQMGITEFNKAQLIEFISSSQVISIYLSVFVMLFIYTFIIYFLNILTYVLFVSIFGCIANFITKLRMRYAAIFNMSVYAVTLSTILYMIYIVINALMSFVIKYFEPMYISIATIYLVAAIFIIKAEFIKKQTEIAEIGKVQEQVRKELENRKEEQNKDEEKEKQEKERQERKERGKEKEKEDNKNNEKEGNKDNNLGTEPEGL